MRSANSKGSGDLLLRAAPQEIVEVEPLDVLHRDEEPVALAAEVEHLDDVRVVEARRELRLVDEHLRELRVRRELGEDLLHDAEPRRAELGVRAGEVDLGHPALADEIEQRVAPELPRKSAQGLEGEGRTGRHQSGQERSVITSIPQVQGARWGSRSGGRWGSRPEAR